MFRSLSQPQLVALISQTPDSSNREFNCQTWVEAVLKRLSDAGYLLQEDYSKGIDGTQVALWWNYNEAYLTSGNAKIQ